MEFGEVISTAFKQMSIERKQHKYHVIGITLRHITHAHGTHSLIRNIFCDMALNIILLMGNIYVLTPELNMILEIIATVKKRIADFPEF